MTVSRASKTREAVLGVYKKERLYVFIRETCTRLIPFKIMNCVNEDNENIPNIIPNHQQRKATVSGQLRRRVNNLLTDYVRQVSYIVG